MLSMSRLHGFLHRPGRAVSCSGVVDPAAPEPHRGSSAGSGSWACSPRASLGFAALSRRSASCGTGRCWRWPARAPSRAVVDFHSHTNVSHDVRGTPDVGLRRRGQPRAGTAAPDSTPSSSPTTTRSRPGDTADGWLPLRCPGIEVSAWRAHIVLLGDTLPVDRGPYSRDWAGLPACCAVSDSAYGARSVASLPEYERNHWARLDSLVAAGLDGFEIVNASSQGERAVPGPPRQRDRAGPAHRPLRRRRERQPRLGRHQHGLESGAGPVLGSHARQRSATGSSAGSTRAWGRSRSSSATGSVPTLAGRPCSPRSAWCGRPGAA